MVPLESFKLASLPRHSLVHGQTASLSRTENPTLLADQPRNKQVSCAKHGRSRRSSLLGPDNRQHAKKLAIWTFSCRANVQERKSMTAMPCEKQLRSALILVGGSHLGRLARNLDSKTDEPGVEKSGHARVRGIQCGLQRLRWARRLTELCPCRSRLTVAPPSVPPRAR